MNFDEEEKMLNKRIARHKDELHFYDKMGNEMNLDTICYHTDEVDAFIGDTDAACELIIDIFVHDYRGFDLIDENGEYIGIQPLVSYAYSNKLQRFDRISHLEFSTKSVYEAMLDACKNYAEDNIPLIDIIMSCPFIKVDCTDGVKPYQIREWLNSGYKK